MSPLVVAALLVYAFGAFAFGTTVAVWLRDLARARLEPGDRLGGAIIFICFGWFLLNAVDILADGWALDAVLVYITCLFPPLIMHDAFTGTCRTCAVRKPSHPGWRLALWSAYATSQAIFVFAILGFRGLLPLPVHGVGRIVGAAFSLLFICAAIYSSLIVSRFREQRETPRERRSRKWIVGLFFLMILVFIPILLHTAGFFAHFGYLILIAKSLPLGFLFVATYHHSRFEFFDRFVKRGAALLLTVGLLAVVFAVTLPWLEGLELGGARAWIYALVLLPLVATLPWLYRRLGHWLDAVWLGRRFTLLQALQHFLSVLQSATTEAVLVEQAECGLEAIFQARARIALGLQEAPGDFECVQQIPIRSGPEPLGVICLGRRKNDTPYFSEDLALLESLSGVFCSMLDNVRLQQTRREQDKQAQALSLQASRSELKALRAQINPHFLFNALNAIAALIHKDPLRADQAVEKLADVFRYTLRRSDNEWALLEEELDFVAAYLEVEQARFGKRLQFEISVDKAVKSVRIPTMIVHTVVENAVKHGIAAFRGPGRIEVGASRRGDCLVIEVADNGPGFDETAAAKDPAGPPTVDGGYGLTNVRQRLAGHFGAEARLELRRDGRSGLTVVGIYLPLARLSVARKSGEEAAGGAAL